MLSGFFYTAGMTHGSLSIDLADVGSTSVSMPPLIRNWHFVWGEFTPTLNNVRVRILRDTEVRLGELGYLDEIGITPLQFFRAPDVRTVPEPSSLFLLISGDGIRFKWETTSGREMQRCNLVAETSVEDRGREVSSSFTVDFNDFGNAGTR